MSRELNNRLTAIHIAASGLGRYALRQESTRVYPEAGPSNGNRGNVTPKAAVTASVHKSSIPKSSKKRTEALTSKALAASPGEAQQASAGRVGIEVRKAEAATTPKAAVTGNAPESSRKQTEALSDKSKAGPPGEVQQAAPARAESEARNVQGVDSLKIAAAQSKSGANERASGGAASRPTAALPKKTQQPAPSRAEAAARQEPDSYQAGLRSDKGNAEPSGETLISSASGKPQHAKKGNRYRHISSIYALPSQRRTLCEGCQESQGGFVRTE